MQLSQLDTLLQQHQHDMPAHALVAVLVRLAKLRPESAWQQRQQWWQQRQAVASAARGLLLPQLKSIKEVCQSALASRGELNGCVGLLVVG